MSTKVNSPDELPQKPGIYIMKDKNEEIIYVGKSKSLKNRVKSYFQKNLDRAKTQVLMSHFNSLEYIVTNSEKEALILEANLIKKHRPRYNIRLKDDKRYPYVKLTDEDFPKIVITRNIGKTGTYYGPFTDVTAVRQTVKFLKQLFRIRTCKRMNGPCLNSQIDLCYGPCNGQITKEEYQEHIKKIDLFFQGKYNKIIKDLESEMKEAASKEEFEKAAIIRDQINSIDEVMKKQFVEFENDLDQDIIAISYTIQNAVVVVMNIRSGKIVGKDDFLMDGSRHTRSDEVISAFIKQYYGINRHIPKEILLEEEIPDNELIEEWLSDLRGNKVSLKVPQKGNKLRLVRMASKNANIIKNQKQKMENSMIELKKYLKLEKLPRVIEGYDISNISGKLAVGSKVSFLDGKPNKKQYKKFKMNTPGPNDFAMMKELLERRLKPLKEHYDKLRINEEDIKNKKSETEKVEPLKLGDEPNLIVIDGGKGQLGMAVDVLNEYKLNHIPIISLAKEFEEIYIPNSSFPIKIPQNNEALHLLQQVRDESHRFAVTYHRKLRSKKIEESPLDNIVGVGKKRKIELLKHFKDLDGVKKASIKEISEVKGMNEKVASNVYNYFNGEDNE
ncbi:excinuclease ABC subunit UvrC [Methanobrevibacter olleyae]|uniref:UvrABC system protein C n=1 Tax=Methanobrevibacter olleyae TaxID=294671 RepID=A0A126QZU9_METOL|nr:excinuclease ABC subunit UvrC [Methanobrevibacter olleyae]AMK15342.1 excinuclease ABC C subunit UvrC [Methanobrevibacter olleyae]SFL30388.1 Excinuclease ABC subunit C [Methanobrevibacter olleyae]